MFLKKAYIENYRTLRKAEVSFEDGLNIIIGKNGVGKSNLLKFISLTASYRSLTRDLRNRNVNTDYSYVFSKLNSQNTAKDFIIMVETLKQSAERGTFNSRKITTTGKIGNDIIFDESFVLEKGESLQHHLSILKGNPNSATVYNELIKLTRLWTNYISFFLPPEICWLNIPQQITFDNDGNLFAGSDIKSENISLTLQLETEIDWDYLSKVTEEKIELSSEDAKNIIQTAFDDFSTERGLIDNLKKYSPIQDLRLTPNINGYDIDNKVLIENLLLEFKINDNWVPWNYLSDGTQRLFYIISECVTFGHGIYLIEEPELGIHPHQLYKLMEFIKDQSRSKQIIISTHSPLVLDVLEPEELNRIIVASIKDGASSFNGLTSEQQEKARAYMSETDSLSNYWLHSNLEGDDD